LKDITWLEAGMNQCLIQQHKRKKQGRIAQTQVSKEGKKTFYPIN